MSRVIFPVLVLIAACVLYIAGLFRISFGRAQQECGKPLRAGLSLRYVLTEDTSDCGYDLLWRTQLPTLDFLRSAGSSGVLLEQMTQFYCEFACEYPELADGSNFSDWLDAMQNAGVAVYCRADARIIITEIGRSILEHLEEAHAVN